MGLFEELHESQKRATARPPESPVEQRRERGFEFSSIESDRQFVAAFRDGRWTLTLGHRQLETIDAFTGATKPVFVPSREVRADWDCGTSDADLIHLMDTLRPRYPGWWGRVVVLEGEK